jgi:hypothetical protein
LEAIANALTFALPNKKGVVLKNKSPEISKNNEKKFRSFSKIN